MSDNKSAAVFILRCSFCPPTTFLFGLKIGVLLGYVLDAWAILHRVQIVMPHNHCLWIVAVQNFQQCTQGHLLFRCARIGGLSPGIQSSFVAHPDGVLVMVHAVGTHQPFRSSSLNLSVTTDHVMIANAEFKASLAVPCIYLGYRRSLVGFHCRTMNHYQGYRPHDCTAIVPRTVVITVAANRNHLATLFQFTLTIKLNLNSFFIVLFFGAKKRTKRNIHPSKASPQGEDAKSGFGKTANPSYLFGRPGLRPLFLNGGRPPYPSTVLHVFSLTAFVRKHSARGGL